MPLTLLALDIISEPMPNVGARMISDPPESAVRAQLAQILAHKIFAGAPKQCLILSVIVNETLRGNGETLKEEVIADAIGLAGYDKRMQSLVRVTVGKIRRNLAKYYRSVQDATIRIDIPKHGFSATFARIEVTPDAKTPSLDSPEMRSTDKPTGAGDAGVIRSDDPKNARSIFSLPDLPDVRRSRRALSFQTTALMIALFVSLGFFVPLTMEGSFAPATIVLAVSAIAVILILGMVPNSVPVRAASALFMLGAMAYFPSAWTLGEFGGIVINMDVLPPAPVYPFITGIKFIPVFVLICGYWVGLGFRDDAGFETESVLAKTYLLLGCFFLIAWVLAGWTTGDYNIWKSQIPRRQVLVFGYSTVLAANLFILLFGYRFFRKKSISSYQRLFAYGFIAYFIVAVAGSIVDHEYNKINECCLDKRRPEAYVVGNPKVSSSATISLPDVGIRLREMLEDPSFRQVLQTEKFYKDDFDEPFQKRASLFGFRDSHSPPSSPRFQLVRFPRALVEMLRFGPAN